MLRNVSRLAAAALAAALATLLFLGGGNTASAAADRAPVGAETRPAPDRIGAPTKGTLHKVDAGVRTQSEQHTLGPDLGAVPPRADLRGMLLASGTVSADYEPAHGRAPPSPHTRAPPR